MEKSRGTGDFFRRKKTVTVPIKICDGVAVILRGKKFTITNGHTVTTVTTMVLQDEMAFQRIEVLLDMQAKKINAELSKLRDELSQAKEELRKEIHAVKQDASFQQAGSAHVQMYAEAPPMQEPQPVPRYAQEQQAPRYAQQAPQGYAQQPQQAYPQQNQQAPPQQTWNQPYPPQMRGGDKPTETRPIDRNNVAPSDVSVEKFFNFSGGARKK